MEFVLLMLLALAIPVCAIGGFALALKLRARTALLERRLAELEAELRRRPAVAATDAFSPPVSPLPQAATAPSGVDADVAKEPASEPPFAPTPRIPPSRAPDPAELSEAPQTPRGFEETLGTRWAVWVGGVALALGGVFLVRYSIEQGLLGPGARVAAGSFFALALVGAGEWMRRREVGSPLAVISSAHVPGVLTAAGTSTAFATAYAAYALYGLIGPGVAFATLGVIAVVTMAASALHGPALAALGLVAALGSPLLVQSDSPQPWALVVYLAFVVFATYGVARLRAWRWLALSAAVGALLWTAPLFLIDERDVLPVMIHLVVQAALAGAFLVADPHRRTPDEDATVDRLAAGVLFGLTALAIVVNAATTAGGERPGFAAVMTLGLVGLSVRYAPAAPAAAWAAFMTIGTLGLWPVAGEIAGEPRTVLGGGFGDQPRPEALQTFIMVALALPAMVAAVSLRRLWRGRDLPLATAAWFAGAGTAGPLLALVVAYWRIAALDRSIPFALVAGALAIAFVAATAWLRSGDRGAMDAVRLTVGATASAAVAALAFGLTFALDKGMLTVAFALAALGAARVAERLDIPALRTVVAGLGLIVLGRLVWDPTIVGGALGATPIFNWLLWGYGVPAIAFYLASRLLERSKRDRAVRFIESLAIVFAAFLVFFEIRHWVQGGDPLAATSDHLEMGLIATASLAFSLLMVRAQARRPDIVYGVGSLIFGAVTLAITTIGLAIVANPLFSGEPVLGGPVMNSLIPAYLLPAVVAAILASNARGARPTWYVSIALGVALVLQLIYTILAIRSFFQGTIVIWWYRTGQAELWSYTVAMLVIGLALLAAGFLRRNRLLRLLSAGYIVAAVLKAFLVDLANLEGFTRALSFIGLGLALVGIGLAYQRLSGGRDRSAASPSI